MPTSRGGRNVEHRQTDPAHNSDPIDRAGYRPGRTTTGTPGRPVPGADTAANIPYAGVRAGEIVGFRLWWAVHGLVDWSLAVYGDGQTYIPFPTMNPEDVFLRSVYTAKIWLPGKPMFGNIDITIGWDFSVFPGARIFAGVYAYSRPGRLLEAANFWLNRRIITEDYDIIALVGGRVKLWGDVIEHEDGYRASFAKPLSLDTFFWKNPFFRWNHEDLRQRYCRPI